MTKRRGSILDLPGVVRPSLHSWRTTTAVRVFALALATGTVLSNRLAAESAPRLVVVGLVAAVSSMLEWMTRNRPTHWYAVGETVAVTTLLVATQSISDLGAYLAVPLVAAGVRHGLVTTLNVTLISGLTVVATVAADPARNALSRIGETLPFLAIGLGVGLLASWQSRTTRDLAARQAPDEAAHHLMATIHRLARSGTLGLNSASLVTEIDAAMRRATGCARSTIFVVDPDGTLRALNAGEDLERLQLELQIPDADRTPGAAVIPLRGAKQVLGYCVLVGVPRWTAELDERASDVANEFTVRLDTAVLFDEVRALATSDERNRIAREMHDGVAQEIVGLGYIVDEIEATSDHGQTQELAAALRAEITRLVSEIRFSIFDLRHEVTDGRLSSSLADYAREVGEATGLRVHLSLAESGPPLPAKAATEVLRIAREAIGNVRKHAQACNLWLTLESDGSMLHLEVRDDGVGKAGPREHHWGLQTMRERAEGVGAELDVTSPLAGGTVVTLRSSTSMPNEGETAHGHHRAAG